MLLLFELFVYDQDHFRVSESASWLSLWFGRYSDMQISISQRWSALQTDAGLKSLFLSLYVIFF